MVARQWLPLSGTMVARSYRCFRVHENVTKPEDGKLFQLPRDYTYKRAHCNNYAYTRITRIHPCRHNCHGWPSAGEKA